MKKESKILSTYGYVSPGNNNATFPRSFLYWLTIIFLVVFLFWSPFQAALFNGPVSDFESSLYWAALFTSFLCFLFLILLLKKQPVPYQYNLINFIVFLLPITYVISSINAASNYLAVNMIIVMVMYSIFFSFSSFILKHTSSNKVISEAIITISYLIVWFGILNWLGNGKFAGSLIGWFSKFTHNHIYTNAVIPEPGITGARLTSVFQYANTYAAYLTAILFIAVFCLTNRRKAWEQIIHGFMLVPILTSLFLTMSRGAIVFLPIILVVVMLFIKPVKQLLWIMHLILSGIITLIILSPITNIGLELIDTPSVSLSIKGWLYLLVASSITSIISWSIQRYASPWLDKKLENFSTKKWSNAVGPIGGTILVLLLISIFLGTNAKSILPENIATRLESINFKQNSVMERFTFYEDSLKLALDYPVFGAGGGAWTALYEKYQNNPYTSRQAHSFYMQYLDEVGGIGFIIFASFILFIYWKYIQSYINSDDTNREKYFIFFILATTILIHSTMDFNMSFVYIGILVFISLGGMTAAIEKKSSARVKPSTFRYVLPSIIGLIGISLFISSVIFTQGANAFNKANKTLAETRNVQQTMQYLKKANDIRPTHPEYTSLTAMLYLEVYKQQQAEDFFTKAEEMLKHALKANPYNKAPLMRQLDALYELKGMDYELYQLYSNNAANFPWDMNWFNKYIDLTFHEGYKLIPTEPEKAKKYLNEAIAAFEHVKSGVDYLTTLPNGQEQGGAFYVTSQMALNAGRSYLMKGELEEGIETMQPYLKEDLSDPVNRELLRWYLAATVQLGQLDHQWYDKLIAIDPDEKERINEISDIRYNLD